MANFEHFIVPKFPGNGKFHSRETGMRLFPGIPGTGTGMDALTSRCFYQSKLATLLKYCLYQLACIHFSKIILFCQCTNHNSLKGSATYPYSYLKSTGTFKIAYFWLFWDILWSQNSPDQLGIIQNGNFTFYSSIQVSRYAICLYS